MGVTLISREKSRALPQEAGMQDHRLCIIRTNEALNVPLYVINEE